MKKNNPFNHSLIALLIFITLSPLAAYSQDKEGNGGDPGELSDFVGRNGDHLSSWYEVKSDLISGFERNRHLDMNLLGINPVLFKTKTLKILKTTAVEFKNEKIIINHVPRPCKNFVDSAKIHHIQCNPETYVKEMQNFTSESQYKLVAHEYFSAAGFEPNSYGLSDYPFSSQISRSLEEVKVKKWGIHEKTSSHLTIASDVCVASYIHQMSFSPIGSTSYKVNCKGKTFETKAALLFFVFPYRDKTTKERLDLAMNRMRPSNLPLSSIQFTNLKIMMKSWSQASAQNRAAN